MGQAPSWRRKCAKVGSHDLDVILDRQRIHNKYTEGGPGLVQSVYWFEQMLNATRENEQHFLEKVRVCSICQGC